MDKGFVSAHKRPDGLPVRVFRVFRGVFPFSFDLSGQRHRKLNRFDLLIQFFPPQRHPCPNPLLHPALYTQLADWWHLLSAPEDYDEEAALFARLLTDACHPPPRTLLELGSGGGSNASFLKQRLSLTLVDLSEGMLAVSSRLNPECEHLQGDMRTLRLERTFDLVFIHDAIVYMTSEADLLAALRTAAVHLRPGGAALFCPDYTRENFAPKTASGGHDAPDGRGARYLEWIYDPDPADSTYHMDFAYLLRNANGSLQNYEDRHVCGLFSQDTWLRLLREVGLEPHVVDDNFGRQLFLATRPLPGGSAPPAPATGAVSSERLERIRLICPQTEIRSLQVNQEGLANQVIIVNEDTVFRFARSPRAAAALESEARLLEILRPRLLLPIPQPFHTAPGELAYPLLPGQPLTRRLLAGLPPLIRQRLADQLGGFLRTLHTTPITPSLPHTSAPVTPEAWMEIRSGVEQKIYPLLLPHQREWAAALFDEMLTDPAAFDYPPALCHGDLAPYHILYDTAAQRISAILDFGVAGTGDPAMDIGNLLQAYGESFVGMSAGVYPELPELMRRGRFYARAIELEWALNGLESGETFWFTAHLGNARDF